MDPIGELIVEGEVKGKSKARGHTATAPCGCEVTIAYFTATSYSADIQRCAEHPVKGRKR